MTKHNGASRKPQDYHKLSKRPPAMVEKAQQQAYTVALIVIVIFIVLGLRHLAGV